ncbi:MAG: metallophosphoesterase [Aggregatilineales bacterium]
MSRRALDLDDGLAMVVTDLHGSWEVYRRLRDLFLEQQAKGQVDRLVLCGDLIHNNDGPDEIDSSLEMMLDVMSLQAEFGTNRVIMLLGNHELPHIYGLSLAKGSTQFAPRFEAALTRLDQQHRSLYRRKHVIQFLTSLPFFVRTRAGVMLTHAGAAPDVTSADHVSRLLKIDHYDLIAAADRELNRYDIESLRRGYSHFTGLSYEEQARRFLAVTSPSDPRYNDLLRALFLTGQSTEFDLMWNTLFSQNELDGSINYIGTVRTFLQCVSEVSPYDQRVLVAGHIPVKNGYELVGPHKLRFASFTHAMPRRAARYLILDCGKPVSSAADLMPHLRPVFTENSLDVLSVSTSAAM